MFIYSRYSSNAPSQALSLEDMDITHNIHQPCYPHFHLLEGQNKYIIPLQRTYAYTPPPEIATIR